jgi:hypothetical protein
MELIEARYYFDGHNRSPAAERAEAEGKLPLTRAIPKLARQIGVTQRQARVILEEWGPCGQYHTGKYARCTAYYDVQLLAQIYDWKGSNSHLQAHSAH